MLINFIKRFLDRKKEVPDEDLIEFEIWRKRKKGKIDYPFLLGNDNKMMLLLREHMNYELVNKHKVLTLEYFLKALDVLEEVGKINKEQKKEIKLELMELNFGSMTLDW